MKNAKVYKKIKCIVKNNKSDLWGSFLFGGVALALVAGTVHWVYESIEENINTNDYALIVSDNEALIIPQINESNFATATYGDGSSFVEFILASNDSLEFKLDLEDSFNYFDDARTDAVINAAKLSITATGTIHILDAQTGEHELIKGSDERILRP